jgi:hypothetical protein
MDLSFASPAGALTALGIVLPVAALVLFERRARRVRSVLRLAPPSPGEHVVPAVGLIVIGLLLALAATQPVLARTTPQHVRADAQAYLVFDNSVSMAASPGPDGSTRLDRAKLFARRLRAALPGIPVGVATFSERALPHLFPSVDAAVFRAVVHESVQISEPQSPRQFSPGEVGTDLGSLAELGANGYFAPTASHRLLVVLTDGESVRAYPATVAAALGGRSPVRTIFVRVWDRRDRIYLRSGRLDPNYHPDPAGGALLETLAGAMNGRAFSETELQAVVKTAQEDLGHGPVESQGVQRSRTPLAPWLVLGAVVPLGIVLRRRNL